MTMGVFDFKAIRKILDRQEQKADFEAKNPEPSMYGWPYGVAVPFELPDLRGRVQPVVLSDYRIKI